MKKENLGLLERLMNRMSFEEYLEKYGQLYSKNSIYCNLQTKGTFYVQ